MTDEIKPAGTGGRRVFVVGLHHSFCSLELGGTGCTCGAWARAAERSLRFTGTKKEAFAMATPAEVTAIVRAADRAFQVSGGSSRHWVVEQFLPRLEAAGFAVVKGVKVPKEKP